MWSEGYATSLCMKLGNRQGDKRERAEDNISYCQSLLLRCTVTPLYRSQAASEWHSGRNGPRLRRLAGVPHSVRVLHSPP